MFKVGQRVVRKPNVPVSMRWQEVLDRGVTSLTVSKLDPTPNRFLAKGSDVYWVTDMFIPAPVKPFVAEDWL